MNGSLSCFSVLVLPPRLQQRCATHANTAQTQQGAPRTRIHPCELPQGLLGTEPTQTCVRVRLSLLILQ